MLSVIFFVLVYSFGQFILLNIFLVILLENESNNDLMDDENDAENEIEDVLIKTESPQRLSNKNRAPSPVESIDSLERTDLNEQVSSQATGKWIRTPTKNNHTLMLFDEKDDGKEQKKDTQCRLHHHRRTSSMKLNNTENNKDDQDDEDDEELKELPGLEHTMISINDEKDGEEMNSNQETKTATNVGWATLKSSLPQNNSSTTNTKKRRASITSTLKNVFSSRESIHCVITY